MVSSKRTETVQLGHHLKAIYDNLDDEYDVVRMMKYALENEGFKNVFGFTDPFLALEHFRNNSVSCSLVS